HQPVFRARPQRRSNPHARTLTDGGDDAANVADALLGLDDLELVGSQRDEDQIRSMPLEQPLEFVSRRPIGDVTRRLLLQNSAYSSLAQHALERQAQGAS